MKVLRHLLLIIAILLPTFSFAQYGKRSIEIDDFFRLKTVGNPQISPDEKWIAYTVRETSLEEDKSETHIWMISTDGGEPIPMTGKGYSAGTPRWSPDGKYLSFLAQKGKDAKTQVWTLNRLGGEAEQLTKVKQGVGGYEWSPDGKRLLLSIKDPKPELLTEDPKDDKKPKPHVIDRLQFKRDYAGYLDRRRNHLYTFAPGDTAPVQITFGDYDDGSPVWSPDGKSIAFVSNRSDNPDGNTNSDIWIVQPDNENKLRKLTTNPREDYAPAWSPDGKYLCYATVTAAEKVMWYATNHLAVVEVATGKSRVLTESLDRNVRRPRWSEDGQSIWFLLEDSAENQLARIGSNGENLERLITGSSIRSFDLQGTLIAPLLGRPDQPAEVFTYQNTQLNQLTTTNGPLLDSLTLSPPENIHFKSADGTEIEGFLYKPIGYEEGKKYPTILRIHGGPVSQYSMEFRFDPQLYAAKGYAVIETNPRGSSGYGQDFSYALFADWGNLDYQDVMAGVDYVIDQGIADPDQLGVGGWSYGGILTNYVITQTDRFKGAVSGASEALYRSNYGHDHYQRAWETELGLPWENAEAWERISPFNKVDKITTPTLWIGGAQDWNVPILNSEQMYQAMKRLGRETQLVVYPGEHHGIRRPSFQKDRFERFLGWYRKYVRLLP